MKFYKFYADWCGPCKVLTANLKKAGVEYEPIDIEENEDLCLAYKIRNVPVFMALDDNNKEIDRFVGIKTPIAIKEWIESLKNE